MEIIASDLTIIAWSVSRKMQMHKFIYVITCTANDKKYIGISVRPKERLNNHIRSLRLGEHVSTEMQNDFDKYGECCFTFAVIDRVDYEDRTSESKYIQRYETFNPAKGYNTDPSSKRWKKSSVKSAADRDRIATAYRRAKNG